MIAVTYRLHRHDHHVRLRGVDPLTGQKIDTTVLVADEVFETAKTKRTSAKAEAVARDFAAAEEVRLNAPQTLRARAVAAQRETAQPATAPEAQTFGKLWEITRTLRAGSVKPATIRRDANRAKLIIEFFDRVEPTPPHSVTLGKSERFVAWRVARGAQPRTVWGDVSFLAQWLRWAVERPEETGVETIRLTKPPKVTGKDGDPKVILKEKQIFLLFDAAGRLPRRGKILQKIIAVGISLRLRRTALLNLHAEWIDRASMWVDVPGRFGKKGCPASLPLTEWSLTAVEDMPTSGPLWTSMYARKQRPIAQDELQAAVATIQSDDPTRDELLVTLARKYRVRAADVAGLTWTQVSIAEASISGVKPNNHYSKTDRIQLDAADVELLRRHRAHSPDATLVFQTKRGRPVTARYVFERIGLIETVLPLGTHDAPITNVDRSLKHACELAGVPVISLQGLRRSGAQILREHRCQTHTASVAEDVIERLLEHGWTLLKRAYGHVSEVQMREAVAVVDCAWRAHCGGNVVRLRKRA